MKKYDVLIVGGGVIGCALAYTLSRYDLRVGVLERAPEVGMGTSKANTGLVHSGFHVDPNSLRGKLNLEANPLFDELAKNLSIPFHRLGSLVLAFNEQEADYLEKARQEALSYGVPGLKWVDREWLRKEEAHINPEVLGGVYAPTGGIVCPFEMTLAMAQNAALNGVDFFFEHEVTGWLEEGGKLKGVKTSKGVLLCAYGVNVAGLGARKLMILSGEEVVEEKIRQGQYILYDREYPLQVKHTLFPVPTPVSKGIIVTPTVHGNLMVGPNAQDIDHPSDVSTSREGLEEVLQGGRLLLPALDTKQVIKLYSGNRAVLGKDFFLQPSQKVFGLIHGGGIQSPGLTAAPRLGQVLARMLFDMGLPQKPRESYEEGRKAPVMFAHLTEEEQTFLIEEDREYGQVICRCETVTRGEVRDAILSPLGARTLDGIKRRTRAASGRCQSGFCHPRLLALLSHYTGVDPLQITWGEKGSEVLSARSKDLLRRGGVTLESSGG